MKKWIKFYKTINGELVAEDFWDYGEWSSDMQIEEDFIDWRDGLMWKKEPPNSKCGYEEVDIPSKEWLENTIDGNKTYIKKIKSENDEYNKMLYKYSRGYKVETIIKKIKK